MVDHSLFEPPMLIFGCVTNDLQGCHCKIRPDNVLGYYEVSLTPTGANESSVIVES